MTDIGKILKELRLTVPLTLQELGRASGVSPSYLGRVERGERFPSAQMLHRIAKPLRFSEIELFTRAGFLSPETSAEVKRKVEFGKLDPSVVEALSEEPVEIQRAILAILWGVKHIAEAMAKGIGFRQYIRTNYPEVDEDIITMIEDLLQPGREARINRQ